MSDPMKTFPGESSPAPSELNARFQDLRRDAAQSVDNASKSVTQGIDQAKDKLAGTTSDPTTKAKLDSTVSTFKDQASQAATEAKGAALSMADQARSRLTEIVDQQKAMGADKISGVAKAAQNAASDLDTSNPQMAKLVRTAAENVDRIADDLRSSDIGDVISTLATFGRQQPVAFFGGAVLAGFLLARFFKSDAPVVDEPAFHGGFDPAS